MPMTEIDDPIAEICEHCSRTINEGDLYFPFDDGPVLCADCSPTWGDAESMHASDREIGEDEDMKEARIDFAKRLDAHIAAGGSKDEKLPLTPL
jgi:hypothetical protein